MVACSDIGFRQKAVIEFLSNEGIAPKEISERLKKVFGDNALSYATVKRWIIHFNSGNKEITDKPRSGRPVSAATTLNKARVDELMPPIFVSLCKTLLTTLASVEVLCVTLSRILRTVRCVRVGYRAN